VSALCCLCDNNLQLSSIRSSIASRATLSQTPLSAQPETVQNAGLHVLRTHRALNVLVSLQHSILVTQARVTSERVVELGRLVQVSSGHFVCNEETSRPFTVSPER